MYINKKLIIKNTQTMGRGVFALQSIEKGQLLIQVPVQNYITFETLQNHYFLGFLVDETDDKKLQFAFYLASLDLIKNIEIDYPVSKGDKIIFNYLQRLPEHFDNLICWRQEELALLCNQRLIALTIQRQKNAKKGYHRIIQSIQKKLKQKFINISLENNPLSQKKKKEFKQYQYKKTQILVNDKKNMQNAKLVRFEMLNLIKGITFSTVMKYYSAIQSRKTFFAYRNDFNSQVGAIIPFIEMINFSDEYCCDITTNSYSTTVTALKKIEKEEQIFLDYGFEQIDMILSLYGFVKGRDKALIKIGSLSEENENVNPLRAKIAKQYKWVVQNQQFSEHSTQQSKKINNIDSQSSFESID